MAFSGKRTACPKCRAEGRDSKGDHLAIFEDGTGGFCHQGGHRVVKFTNQEEGERISSPSYEGNKRDSGVDMALAATYPILEYAPRLLTKEAMEHFGVRTAVSQEDASPEEHWYPYHDPADGSITGYKVRGLRGKTFRTVGKVKSFFGQHLITGGKFLIVTEGECLSGDTEVLSPSGWVRLDQYAGEDVLACVVGGEFPAFFEQPSAYISKEWDGVLYENDTEQVSFACTENHGMIVRSRSKFNPGGWEKRPYSDFGCQNTVPKSAVLDGSGIDLTPAQIALCLAVSADAYIYPPNVQAGPERSVGQQRVKITVMKDRKKTRLREIFQSTGTPWKEWENPKRPEYVEFYFTLPDYCSGRMLDWNWITFASKEQREFILKELTHWDGNFVPDREQTEYASKHFENAEWVQTLAHTTGYSSTIISRKNSYGSWYKVSVLLSKKAACFDPRRAKVTKPTDGRVYCVTTSTGAFLCRRNNKIMVIGNCDAIASYAMMRKLKPERAPYNVVSIPFGADEKGTLDKEIKNQIEWLSSFEKVVLCFDNDGPGKATATALAEFLCSHTNVSIAALPLKDTAAMWEAGREQEWAQAINNARKYVSDQISVGTETTLDELLKPLERGLYFPFLPKTCSKLRGFRTKELTILLAPEKAGKTSLLRQMTYHILSTTNEHVGGFFMEETAAKSRQSILAYHAGVPLNEFRANPKCADKRKIEEAYDTLLPRLHLFTHKGKTITDDIVERKVEYMVKALGCKTVMFDHFSFVLGTRDTRDERRELDMLITKLARSVENFDYRLIGVAHIKRGAKEQSRSDRNQKYPYWEYLTSDAGRGSGAFEQLCHNMVAIEKEILDPANDNTRGAVRTRVLLAREWGVSGLGDYLSFDERGQFTPIEVSY